MELQVTWILLSILISIILYLLWKIIVLLNYWKDRNIPYEKPLPLIGNNLPVITFKSTLYEIYEKIYKLYPNEKAVGMHEFLSPVLILRDPGIIEKILVKDFQYFTDHTQITEENSLVSKGLFQLKGGKWRAVRMKISPSLSTGKLKSMFKNMLNCTEEMLQSINENLNRDLDIRNILAAFTTTVIANSIFGIALTNKVENNKFVKHCNKILYENSFSRNLQIFALSEFPKLASWLGFKFLTVETENYFKGIIKNTLNQRKLNKEYERDDYVQQLLKLKEQGKLEIQSKDEDDEYLGYGNQEANGNVEMTDELLFGQAFQFILAGFDPIIISALCLIYELARYQDIQDQAREEVKKVLAKHNGYTYEALKEMTYLEQCIQETLRLHPIAPFLVRECTKDYNIPEIGLRVEKRQKLIIPLLGIHRDAKYYPEPDKFKPDRFPPNTNRQKFTYMPFGDGPRICVGMRFAIVMMKLLLAKILENYTFTLSPKTKVPFTLNKNSAIIYVPNDQILVQFKPVSG